MKAGTPPQAPPKPAARKLPTPTGPSAVKPPAAPAAKAPPAKLAPAKPTPAKTPAAKSAVAAAIPARPQTGGGLFAFFKRENVRIDQVADEAAEEVRSHKLFRRATRQAWGALLMTGVVIMAIPFFQPIDRYYAINPDHQTMVLAPLLLPNLTDKAVLSWAATSVTGIMTLGFGDFEQRLLAQKKRFTKDGWEAFAHAFLNDKIDESFRQHQLVMTTVPANTPVVISEGENENHVYQWKVEMPIVVTYSTNNDVSRASRSYVDLTIVRVPYEQSSAGIAIDTWHQSNK